MLAFETTTKIWIKMKNKIQFDIKGSIEHWAETHQFIFD
jgi:hypothetical protein